VIHERPTRRQFVEGALALPALVSLARSASAARAPAGGRPIRVGQIGTKHAHARGHTRTLLKYPAEFELVGVAEPDPERRAAESRDALYGGTPWLAEEELLRTPGLQAVAVETEVRDLLATAQRCLDAGLHVHLDKPAGDSYAELVKLHDTAERRGLAIQMGYMFRYNPGFRLAFRAVREGWLGEVFEIHAEMSKTLGPEARRTIAEYPGGAMFELGCHLIDPIVHMMGAPEKVTPYIRRSGLYPDGLADNTLAVLEYPKATATVRSAVIEVEGTRRRQLAVCGDRGTLVIQPLEPPRVELTLLEPRGGYPEGTRLVELPEAPGRYDESWLDFARVIRGEKRHDFSHDHDLAVQRTLLRASGVPLA